MPTAPRCLEPADRFFTTWLTLMLPPGAIIAGVNVTVGTFRSGRSTVRVPVSNVLLLSSASTTVAARVGRDLDLVRAQRGAGRNGHGVREGG